MVIEVSRPVEDQLRELAQKQGREIGALIEEALREYLEATTITDLATAAVGQTQMALLDELPGISEWKDEPG
jgi:predicted transcriptional regulator